MLQARGYRCGFVFVICSQLSRRSGGWRRRRHRAIYGLIWARTSFSGQHWRYVADCFHFGSYKSSIIVWETHPFSVGATLANLSAIGGVRHEALRTDLGPLFSSLSPPGTSRRFELGGNLIEPGGRYKSTKLCPGVVYCRHTYVLPSCWWLEPTSTFEFRNWSSRQSIFKIQARSLWYDMLAAQY